MAKTSGFISTYDRAGKKREGKRRKKKKRGSPDSYGTPPKKDESVVHIYLYSLNCYKWERKGVKGKNLNRCEPLKERKG